MKSLMIKVIESTPEEFLDLLGDLRADPLICLYAQGLQSYLLNEQETLQKIIFKLEELPAAPHQKTATLLLSNRLALRQLRVSSENIAMLKAHLKGVSDPLWHGETLFVLGMGLEMVGLFTEASEFYHKASREFRQLGAHRKAAKSELNAICADSHIHHDVKRHIANYLRVSRSCRRVREWGMAGLALSNVASEYCKLGAHNVALKYCKKAVSLLERDCGSQHYYFALLQRAEVLFELKRTFEAQMDLEECSVASFPEVIEALKILKRKFIESSNENINTEKLIPAWREKLELVRTKPKLGALEQKLLGVLAEGPQTRHELIERLYDTTAEYASLENRFHVLLSRIKHKVPHTIILEGSHYRLVDDLPLFEEKNA